MRDRGSMTLVALCAGLAVTAATTAAMVPMLEALVDRQAARSAADAAALAGVTGGRAAAAEMAARNGAVLLDWSRAGRDVTVEVGVDGQRAVARATGGP